MARSIIDILGKYDLYPGDIQRRKPCGRIGCRWLGLPLWPEPAIAYGISTTSGSFVTTPLAGRHAVAARRFHACRLAGDRRSGAGRERHSEIQNIEEFIAAAKANPMNIGGTGTVNVDFIVPTLFAQKAGFEFDYVSFNSMSDQTTALLVECAGCDGRQPRRNPGPDRIRAIFVRWSSRARTFPRRLQGVPTMGDTGL